MRESPTTAGAVHFAAKDRALRDDVRRLGSLLGQLLRELAPPGVFETVESARRAARRRRRGDEHAGRGPESRLQDARPEQAGPLGGRLDAREEGQEVRIERREQVRVVAGSFSAAVKLLALAS